jgi:hypothetical protein
VVIPIYVGIKGLDNFRHQSTTRDDLKKIIRSIKRYIDIYMRNLRMKKIPKLSRELL